MTRAQNQFRSPQGPQEPIGTLRTRRGHKKGHSDPREPIDDSRTAQSGP